MPSMSEANISKALVEKALTRGWSVSVNDGEEWTVKKSRNLKEIMTALATTSDDTLRFHDENGNYMGFVWLVWGNHEDVISVHTDNDHMNNLVKSVIGV